MHCQGEREEKNYDKYSIFWCSDELGVKSALQQLNNSQWLSLQK